MKLVMSSLHAGLAFADRHGEGLAAMAALIGIPVLIFQILQGARQERRRSKARKIAALSALPITLSGINAWAKSVARSLKTIYPWVKGMAGDKPAPKFDPPPSPDHLIAAIEKMIEADFEGRIAVTLASIVSDIQVVSSRIGDAQEYEPRNLRSQLGMVDSNLFLVASIYARSESLYNEARNLSENAPIDYARVSSALNIMDVREGNFADVHAMVSRKWVKQQQHRRGYEKMRDGIAVFFKRRRDRKTAEKLEAQMARDRTAPTDTGSLR